MDRRYRVLEPGIAFANSRLVRSCSDLVLKQANADWFVAHEKKAKATISQRAPIPFAASACVRPGCHRGRWSPCRSGGGMGGGASREVNSGGACGPAPSRGRRPEATDSIRASDRSSCAPAGRSAPGAASWRSGTCGTPFAAPSASPPHASPSSAPSRAAAARTTL